ncbi:hypothetical protein RSOL_144050 [Rhizoctonia solani AG-3 Rhs1AP]|uniref:Uncharacterized protein n=1 Tax=Rhizoctonia solani AG-3 Rhs1AP TaxID=1086054 RepID=X8J338_9AGAM|nr:hypothetical protein RSOL_144050 [Rhizoctonia solani AG-3 Rhs1AP]
MSDPNNSGGNTIGGGAGEPLPPDWAARTSGGSSNSNRGSGAGRVGRIGDWGGTNAARGGSSRGGFATLRDLAASNPPPPSRRPAEDDDDDEEDNGQPLNFFTGGEHSGLSVQNPEASRRGPPNLVRDIFKKAAEGSSANPPAPANDEPRSSVFAGGGHTLEVTRRNRPIFPIRTRLHPKKKMRKKSPFARLRFGETDLVLPMAHS